MKQASFESRHRDFWQKCEALLNELESGKTGHHEQFLPAYRQLCQHIAIARHRGYSPHLVEYLNQLNWRGHQLLYKQRSSTLTGMFDFIRVGFPDAVRRHMPYVGLATALMYLPTILLIMLILWQPEWVFYLLDSHQLAQYEAMYDPGAEHIGRAREADSNVAMFGFYIQNNIGVAFRTFATGILFTVGSLFFLIFNGIFFGVIAGHLSHLGYSDTFWTFVIAHGAFEITAITFAGAAGIKLGFSLLAPGSLSRLVSLQNAAKDVVPILYGMTGMLVIAAFIEAFWSSNSSFSPTVKYSVGAVMWILVICYFTWSGKRYELR